jgi:diguanylate cyclase (GGDEF)-like protein
VRAQEQTLTCGSLALRTLAALLLLTASTTALAGDASFHPMRFDRLSLDDGLSQSNVFAIWQDSTGHMWFATENGLNKYDGYEFEHFKRERGNPFALPSDYIFDIAEDAKGNLWFATRGGGVARLDQASGRFATYRHAPEATNTISSNFVRSLLIDREQRIWLGTRGAGLDRLNPDTGRIEHFVFEDDAANHIYALYEDRAGMLWVGSNFGLARLDPASGEITSFAPDAADDNSLSDPRVRAILEDSEGTLWVGTYGGGLNRLDRNSGTFTRFKHDPADPHSLANDRVTSIFEDADGRLWVGTSGGLNLVDRANARFTRVNHDASDPTSLGDDRITALYQDRGGVLWVGTRHRGVSKWNPRTWSYGLEPARELSADAEIPPNVMAFAEGSDGRLWIGTFGDGLSVVDRDTGRAEHYRHDPQNPASLGDDRVMSLQFDRNGTLWVGTMTDGLNRLDPATGRFEHFRHQVDDPTSLSANGIMSIFQDSSGLVWVGTFGGGISRFDHATGKFTRFLAQADDPDALSSNRVHVFAEDAAGHIWIGTDAGGLNLFDPSSQRFHHFRHDPLDPKSLASDSVYAINIDADGTVWVGTSGGGLDRVVGNPDNPQSIHFENVSQVDGLANDVIYGIHFDQTNRLWMSTNYGISRYDPNTGDIHNLHRRDGLQSEEFNFGAHFSNRAGEMFFGGHNGYNAFDPAGVAINTTPPLIALSAFLGSGDRGKGSRPLADGEEVELGFRDDVLTFEFAALDFAAPSQNRYMYKLEGFDKEWVDLGNRRRVTYTDLDAGRYLMRVKAANADGIWNEVGFALPVKVAAPPWQTWWAYLGYALMLIQLGTALWLWHRFKVRREEQYSLRLEAAVRDRTEKLAASNRQLKELNRTLQETSLTDPLTGLRNRRFVFDEVSRDLEVIRRKMMSDQEGLDPNEATDLVFMMIDLDNFKPINDTYGHAAGDQMLLEVRDVLLSTCRTSDFVIRWGGDEFVVIARQARPGESERLAERIRTRIAEHSFALGDGQIVRTTCSIGFTAYPLFKGRTDASSMDQILGLADGLMYEAKKMRNAWAGMLSPSDAVTSFDFDQESLEPTSLLFRARQSGRLERHGADPRETLAAAS